VNAKKKKKHANKKTSRMLLLVSWATMCN